MAEETIPPGNSAVNQYTESLPTPGGGKNTENGGRRSRPSPDKTLGSKNAGKLESKGDDGRAAAEVAAETAPSPAPVEEEEAETSPPPATGNKGNGGGNSAGNGGNGKKGKGETGGASPTSAEADEASGSSGVGEVIGEATGDSSGTMGWLLPLLIVAVAIWAVAYAMRQRRQAS